MGDLVEIRHRAEYGQVYGLTSGAYSLGFITGTVGAGVLVDVTSFNWVCRGIAVLMILYTCICILFRNPKGTNLDTEDPETLKLVGSEFTDKYGAQKSHDIPMSNE
ncbi:chromaffin granule amine transporter [Lingula anatina]|uniref:Chromaffin granule amine transporter n=1 Tax=Lingula anatina TaxID=7574 RepID=A0A1S3JYQ8_LINAN|nr:chromaffin granule amine transporter [Lingula anatina]|eukprot:XP_013415427.1 chromaffin granule amine transporter [Lingula anatina]